MLSNFSEVMAHMDKVIENGQRCSAQKPSHPGHLWLLQEL